MNSINLEKPNNSDHFIRYKKTYTNLSIISGALLAVFIILTAWSGIQLSNTSSNSQKVTAYVESVYDSKFGNQVKVVYDDRIYELINVIDSELYKYELSRKQEKSVEVLLGDDGKLYSNIEGIKNNSPIGKLYFVFLPLTLLLIFSSSVLIGCVVEAKKREKGIYPKGYKIA